MPHPIEGLLVVYEHVVDVSLVLGVFFAKDPQVEDLFNSASALAESCLLFGDDLVCLWSESVQDDLQHDFAGVIDQTDGAIVLA